MFEKLKEYGLYVVLGLIALGSLAYAYIQTSNSQKGAELHEANLDAMVTNMSKSEKLKKNSTVAEELLQVNGGKAIGKYRIDDAKVSYVVGETYDTIFNNKKTVDISSDLDVTDGKLRLILIANPATQIDGEDVNTINLNSDKSISYGANNIDSSNLRNVANELKGYNISAIGYGPFENEQSAKDFRDDYFSQYEIYQIGETGKYIILTEYNSTGSTESLSGKVDSKTSTSLSDEGGDTCNEYLCLDANGVTMKAKPDTACGQEYEFQGQNYYVVCDNPTLLTNIIGYGYDPRTLSHICGPSACQPGYTPNNVITTKMTDFSSLLYSVSSFNSDISSWDTSNVTSTSYMFYGTPFDQDIGNWNVSNITDMNNMFSSTNFNNGGSDSIKNWNVSNVTNMSGMFSNSQFNQPIGGWNTDNVTSMGRMFRGDGNFNQPIGGWNTSNVTDMPGMFGGAESFNQNIGSWDVSNVTSMDEMFYRAYNFNNGGSDSIGSWNTSNVTSISYMFSNATSFNQDISSWNVSHVTWRQRSPKSTFDEGTSASWTSDKKPNFN